MRKLALVVATFAAFMIAPAMSNATITSVLNGDLTCGVVQNDASVTTAIGQRWCGSQPASITNTVSPALPVTRSTHKTFDGVPLDVNVAFPAESGGDTDWPVVGMFHGYGGSKMNFSAMQRWLDKGYAVYSVTNRGSGESCSSAGSQAADPTGCANGYVHLMDPRYEIRDTQNFLGELVDQGVISPTKIAATGGSYGGSESLHLGILKNRVVNLDGTYHPWTSPLGEAMSVAVATPNIPWSDLMQALAPNGDTYDYLKDGSFNGNVGVMKESFVNGLYISARNAPVGTDPTADLVGWKTNLDAGEPYTSAASTAMVNEITAHHSAYYDDHSQAPAPLLLSPGFTDDLFPVDEVIRYYNRTRAQYPNTPMSIFTGSFGHQRGQTQANVSAALSALENDWVDYYLKGTGSQPASNVTAYTQTCPNGTAGGGPYTANDWASIAPGELVLKDAAAQTIAADGGDPTVSATFNPVPAGQACATAPNAKETGTANYDMPAAPAAGYTVLGSATVLAKIAGGNPNSQVAVRLLDINPAGTETLISRASWRPADTAGYQVFQLHPGAWKVESGHSIRLQLLPKDAAAPAGALLSNYSRPSNSQAALTVSQLELRVPVVEAPGSLDGLVKAPAKKVLPDRAGAELAPGYSTIGSETLAEYTTAADKCPDSTTGTQPNCVPVPVVGNLSLVGNPTVKGKTMAVKVTCKIGNDSCRAASIVAQATGKVRGIKKPVLARGSGIKAKPGQTRTVQLKLTSKARKLFRDSRKKGKKVKGIKKVRATVKINGKKVATKTIKKVGKVK